MALSCKSSFTPLYETLSVVARDPAGSCAAARLAAIYRRGASTGKAGIGVVATGLAKVGTTPGRLTLAHPRMRVSQAQSSGRLVGWSAVVA